MTRPCTLPGGSWSGRPQRLIQRYARQGRTARDAAKVLGVTKSAVLGRANRTGVEFDPPPEVMAASARKAGLASAAARRARTQESADGR